MTRAELLAWATHPAQQQSKVARAVRTLFHDFKMLAVADGVPGYESVKEEIDRLKGNLKAYERENERLRKERNASNKAHRES